MECFSACVSPVLLSHTPVLVQVGDGPVADVAAVHGARESYGRHALVGRLQSSLQGRPDCSDGQDPPAAGDHASLLQRGAGMEDLQPRVLNLGQA